MIRVLFISHGPMLYGAQSSLLALLAGINRDIVTPFLLVPRDGPLTDEARKLNIPVIFLPLCHWVAFGQAAKASYAGRLSKVLSGLKTRTDAIAAVIEKHGIDLVYTNTVTCIEGALAARATHRRHTWHLREHVAGNKDLKPLLPHRIISYIVGALSDRVIVNSRALAQAYSCANINKKVSVVHNGIDLSSFQQIRDPGSTIRQELSVGPDTKIIATIGSITPRKGHSIFIEAASKLKDSFEDVEFLIVGDGEKQLVSELTAKARRMGLADTLHFVGWRTDIANIMAGINLLVVSAEQEAFGRTIIEAMAAGVPVVATRSGGPEEIVIDGVTGFLVPVNNPEQLAVAAARILSNNDLAFQFSKAGHARVKEHFSEDVYVRNIETIIVRLADPTLSKTEAKHDISANR